MSEAIDLFGQPAGPAQLSLFGGGDDRLQAPAQVLTPDPGAVREQLKSLLETAQRATVMPWGERDARMWQTVFPNMAKWLPQREADQLRFAFQQELDRLKAA